MHLGQRSAGVGHQRVGGVERLQNHRRAVKTYLLQRGFVTNAHHRDLPVLHLGLAAHGYQVAVHDLRGHAVAPAGQDEIRVPLLGHGHLALNVLLGQNRHAAGNAPHQRQALQAGQRLAPRGQGRAVHAHQVGGGGVQRVGKQLHLGLRDVRLAVLDLADRAFVLVAQLLGQVFHGQAQFQPPCPDAVVNS